MDYCLPYSSNVNLLYPDLQCQCNRIGISCSQCQQPLSMVFGSSRCMERTNIHIFITIIVIVAGILLVAFLYPLNLTVTKGAINGIILYANIISINDSYFLINNNAFRPLKVFISFTNLALRHVSTMEWIALLKINVVTTVLSFLPHNHCYLDCYSKPLFLQNIVLATLFLLSYTNVLRTVLTVLFSYSTVTHLPSGHQQIV